MTLITRPMKVRVLGEIFDSARPLTIFCSSQPLPLPNALVQVMGPSPSLAQAAALRAPQLEWWDDGARMPLHYLRRLTGKERTQAANRELAFFLAFVAGAANAGGYLAVRQYTSHMSGIVSAMAANLALGNGAALLAGAEALASFVAGA